MISNRRCLTFVLLTVSLVALLCPLGAADVQAGESGATLTPDKAAYLVNKDLGSDRWTIGLNVLPDDVNRVINVTGNVFHSDGGAPSFVVCQVNAASAGTLTDPSSGFSFTCRGSGPCSTTATACGGASAWPLISDDVSIAASFFLPADGLGNLASAAAGPRNAACGSLACRAQRLGATMAAAGSSLVAAVRSAVVPMRADAQSNDRGATLSFDAFAFLVNKDVGNERWSIALNMAPVATAQGTVSRIQSVTGNVFKRDGSAPSFVYCTERPDSQGSLGDPSSQFRVSCSGTAACASTAAECAQSWAPISDDIALPASFFLPPGGLPAQPQSDPEIVVIGRTSDPSAVVTKDFTSSSGASAEGTVAADGCAVGSSCLAARIGGCTEVRGEIVDISGFGCGCQVDQLASCVTCGDGASGTCGGECDFVVGQFTARGQCLPVSSDSSACGCYAIGGGQPQTVRGCSGPLDSACPSDRCCADDPRDGCNVATGDVTCAGICVPSSCTPGQACGICLTQQQATKCGNGVREGSEQCDGTDLPAGCVDLGFGGGNLGCTGDCRFDTSGCSPLPNCGDGHVDPGEQCDGTNLDGQTCSSVVGQGSTGTLSCARNCQFDTSSCSAPPVCGDGNIDPGEECDGTNLGGQTCSSVVGQGLTGALSCTQNCQFNTSSCSAPAVCGDGNIDSGEDCDGTNLGGETCQFFGFAYGTLACSRCRFNSSDCRNKCIEDAECEDGVFCNGIATCDVTTGICNGVDTCPAFQSGCLDYGSCDEATRQCPAVPNNGRCPAGTSCDSHGSCVSD